jgi:hypothetical protein
VGQRLYISGYPNGKLLVYDLTHRWNLREPLPKNPTLLGEYFPTSRIKYSRQLVWSPNGRLYAAGDRARDGQGTGVGYYDGAGSRDRLFTGHFGPPSHLNFLAPIGLIDIGGRVVLSGQVVPDPQFPGETPTVAQLVSYDHDLNEISRTTVKAANLDTGQLFKISDTVVMGVVTTSKSVYLFDISTGKVLPHKWVHLSDEPKAAVQRVDGSVWVMLDRAITRIDPMTLELKSIGNLGAPASNMAWAGDDLYLSIGPELHVVRSVP